MAALLKIDGVKKHFGGVRALDGVDLTLDKGQIYCIVGPNGCGKTTLLGVISGDHRPTAGTIRLAGQDITGLSPPRIARLGILRKFQAPGVCPTLSVAENLEAALMTRVAPWGRLFARRHLDRLRELLDITQLASRANTAAAQLAHGEKQWLEIAMLLGCDCEVLLLDEPTAGMTSHETLQTVALIKRIATEHRRTILAVEHDMHFVAGLECEVIAMMRGTVLRRGTYEQISQDPEVIEAYLGGASHA